MIAFFLRLAGCFVLAAGTVFAIGDIARSLSGSRLRLTTLAEGWQLLGGTPLSTAEAPLSTLVELFAPWPASGAFAVLAILLILAGRRRKVAHRAY